MINKFRYLIFLVCAIVAKPFFASDSGLPTTVNGRKVIGSWQAMSMNTSPENKQKLVGLFHLLSYEEINRLDINACVYFKNTLSAERMCSVQEKTIGGQKQCREGNHVYCISRDCKVKLLEFPRDMIDAARKNELRDTDKAEWVIEARLRTHEPDNYHPASVCSGIFPTDSQKGKKQLGSEYHQARLPRPGFFYEPQGVIKSVERFKLPESDLVAFTRESIDLQEKKLDRKRVGLAAAVGFIGALVGGFKLWSMYKNTK